MARANAPALALLLCVCAAAQQQMPHAGYVYPAGGQQGTTFEVTVGGQFLDNVSAASISGEGAQASIVEHHKPLTGGQASDLRDQAKALQDKPNPTAEERAKLAEIRAKLLEFSRRPMTPAISETVRVNVTLAANAALGFRQLRLTTPNGLTNPVIFSIGQLPEVGAPPAKVQARAGNAQAARDRGAAPPPADPPMDVTPPILLNGQITPGAVDRFHFPAKRGQHIVAAAQARELLPYVSDAVPGWFQATLALKDPDGREVQYADHFQFHPDPVLYFEIPADGVYTLEIHDSIYRGREDFVYRIALGELPFVTSIFPLGTRAGSRAALEVKGWNLPSHKLIENTKGRPAGVLPVSVHAGGWTSNPAPFAIDALPEVAEKEPNDRKERAQRVKLPVIVNGRVDRPGDWDVFRIDGHAGEEIVAEVVARRLNSPLDSLLRLTDSAGKELAVNDDAEDKGAALLTHQADSRVIVKLPANGAYYLYLGDSQGKGGGDYAYRLRIAHPQPDYELRVAPASLNARAGATVPITVYAIRRDGFNGEIALKLKEGSGDFLLTGGKIPAGADSVRVALSMPLRPQPPGPLAIEGRADIQGREVLRLAVPAEDMMQAFYYHHLVPVKDWMCAVTGDPRPNARAAWKVDSESVTRLPRGGVARIHVAVNARLAETFRVDLDQPPEGISVQSVETVRDGVAIVLKVDGKAKAGLKGNLIVDAFTERTPNANAPKSASRRVALGTLPAIPFEVVDGAVARR